MIELQKRVKAFVLRHRLFQSGERVVVGVSGGPDSLCLLHLLAGLQKQLGVELMAAHLDHGLRPESAQEEAGYVQEVCSHLGVPLERGAREVRAYRAQRHLSLEEAARELRYDFFAQVALPWGAGVVVVGHTADDQVETILLNLVRGTGLRGLRGMAPVSSWKDLRVVRPLLEIPRQETEAYCSALGLQPHYDPSNLSLNYTRNRVRRQLLPILEALNPRFRQALLRLARSAARDLAYLEEETARTWDQVARTREDGVHLDLRALSLLPPALQYRALGRALRGLLGPGAEAVHLEGMLQIHGRPGAVVHLPRGLTYGVGYGQARLGSGLPPCPLPPLEGEHPLQVPGETWLPGWHIVASLVPRGEQEEEPFLAYLDWGRAGPELQVRARHPGDRFIPLGMGVEKRLQDFLVDEKVPRAWRSRVPLVVSRHAILWVVGYRINDRYKITPATSQALVLRFALLPPG